MFWKDFIVNIFTLKGNLFEDLFIYFILLIYFYIFNKKFKEINYLSIVKEEKGINYLLKSTN